MCVSSEIACTSLLGYGEEAYVRPPSDDTVCVCVCVCVQCYQPTVNQTSGGSAVGVMCECSSRGSNMEGGSNTRCVCVCVCVCVHVCMCAVMCVCAMCAFVCVCEKTVCTLRYLVIRWVGTRRSGVCVCVCREREREGASACAWYCVCV
jgi:hypothetical protein